MLTRIAVHNQSGVQIAEITPEIHEVGWRLNKTGIAKMGLSYAYEKCTAAILAPANRLYCEFDNMDPWGGVIDFTRTRDSLGVTTKAYTGEKFLDWRYTAKNRSFDSATPGYIFQTLIEEENAEYSTGVVIGDIWIGGTPRSTSYHHQNLLSRLQDLQKLTGNDFVVRPVLSGGILSFEADWYERRGEDKSASVYLTEGTNIGSVKLDEQGPVSSRVITIGHGQGWADERPTKEASDTDSRDTYGYREFAIVQSTVKDPATLQTNADNLLAERKAPRRAFEVTGVVDVAPALFADYGVGDIVTLRAFTTRSEWAFEGPVRVTGRVWFPNDTCQLEVEEYDAT